MNRVVARRLGLRPSEERRLRSAAVARIGRRPYLLRQAAFLAATTPPLCRAIPRRYRQPAIEPLVFALMPDQAGVLDYLRGS